MKTGGAGEKGGGAAGPAAVLAGILCVAVMLLPAGARAQAGPQEAGAAGTAEETAWQAASLLATLPYGAAKLGVALLGSLVGGIGYVLSGGDLESSQQIWDASLRGTYVLSPEHLRGEQPIVFVVLPEDRETETQP